MFSAVSEISDGGDSLAGTALRDGGDGTSV